MKPARDEERARDDKRERELKPARAYFTERLGRRAARHPKRTLAIWLAVAVAGAIVSSLWVDVLVATDDFVTTPESKQVERLVAERLPGAAADMEIVVVGSAEHRLGDADGVFERRVVELARRIEGIGPEHITSVVSIAGGADAVASAPGGGTAGSDADATTDGAASEEPGAVAPGEPTADAAALAQALVSDDGDATILLVTLAGSASEADVHTEPLYDLVRAEDGRDGFAVAMTGDGTWAIEAHDLATSDLRRGELIGVPMAMIILVLVFGAVVAALVPLALAAVAIALATALTILMGVWFDVSIFATNIITMMGLAVGIDYSLLIVSRFREERCAGCAIDDAVGRSAATASRAVFFSGGIVVLALTGMLIVPYSIFTSLGAGSIFVVIAAVAAALTLLPAVLRLLGDRVDRLRVPLPGRRKRAAAGSRTDTGSPAVGALDASGVGTGDRQDAGRGDRAGTGRGEPDGVWTRAARAMMRRPLIALVAGCGALLILTIPLLDMKTGISGVREFPDSTSAKRAFVVLEREFSAGLSAPILVTIEGDLADPAIAKRLEQLQALAGTDERFELVGFETAESGDLAVVKLAVNADSTSEEAMEAVHYLREEVVPLLEAMAPVDVLVGGVPGLYTDAIDMIDAYTPWVIGVVLALSFWLLLVAFRSLVIAVQSILMNLLSVGAAYGLVTLVFQEGYGAGLLGFTQVERILAWLPLMMFCVLFGLSMDYHIFLLSRIRERYDECGDTREAVVFGVGSTAGIITGAAAIMVAVFAGVAMGEMSMFQQLGFGLAVAIAIDATIVRTVIVPTAMTLLGRWSWYLPKWLEWLPRVRVDAAKTSPTSAKDKALLSGATSRAGAADVLPPPA
ncbi:MAG: MMPL family transporter [Thermoleophilia bacterium]|nr:MMPL family transporter [Thermoleophilia bacterium]